MEGRVVIMSEPRKRKKSKLLQAPTESEIQDTLEKTREVVRHKQNVLDACILLGEKLIESGETDLGRQLISHGFEHDLSKLGGIEFDFLPKYQEYINSSKSEEEKEARRKNVALAVDQHNRTNKHHPEWWGPTERGSIKKMPRVFLAEMVCDWKARSGEMGSDLVDFIEKVARKRFHFTKRDAVYEEIMFFVGLLLNKKFEPLPEVEETVV